MKRADIDTLLADTMISGPQHAAIVDRYSLDATEAKAGSKLGGIFAMIGAALCVAGIALVTWLSLEADTRDSWLYSRLAHDYVPTMSWIGALLLALSAGIGFMPQLWRGERFNVSAEVVGDVIVSLGLLFCILGWYGFGFHRAGDAPPDVLHSLPVWLTAVALTCVTVRSLSDRGSPPLGRIAWAAGVAAAIVVPWVLVANPLLTSAAHEWKKTGPLIWLASATLLCFALVLIQRGIARASRALINIGIAFVAANIIAVYFRLFGNMMNTGITFVAPGALLVLLAWQMERWRRRLSVRVDAQASGANREW